MFLPVRRCAEHMTQLPKLKVKVVGQGQRIYPSILGRLHISWTFQAVFNTLHPNVPLSVTMCRTYDSAMQTQGQGHVICPSIRVRSISPKTFERFSLNFTQMFLLERRCAEHMPQLHRLMVKVVGQGQRNTPWISWLFHISWTLLWFSLNFTHMVLIVRRCTEHTTQLPSMNPLDDFN